MPISVGDVDWATVAVNPHEFVLFRELQDEGVLLDMSGEQYYSLDEVGARMWKGVVSAGSPVQAIDGVLEEFDVDRATVESDLADLLNDLEARGLITVTTASHGKVA